MAWPGLQAAAGQHDARSTCRDGRGRRRRRTAAGRPNSLATTISVLSSSFFCFQVDDQRRQRLVELLDQRVLLQDAVVVNVPAGAVEEVEVVRDLDEPHARLDQPPGEQAALAELAAVGVAQAARLLGRARKSA